MPILPPMVDEFRKPRIQTQQEGAPFVGFNSHHFDDGWIRIAGAANLLDADGLPLVTLHDLRRTEVTRLILTGTPLPTVMKLAGHKSIAKTTGHCTKIAREDLRAGVEMLRKPAAGGLSVGRLGEALILRAVFLTRIEFCIIEIPATAIGVLIAVSATTAPSHHNGSGRCDD